VHPDKMGVEVTDGQRQRNRIPSEDSISLEPMHLQKQSLMFKRIIFLKTFGL